MTPSNAINRLVRAVQQLPHDPDCDLLLFLGQRKCDCPKSWVDHPDVVEAINAT